jgi:hypothetical protein
MTTAINHIAVVISNNLCNLMFLALGLRFGSSELGHRFSQSRRYDLGLEGIALRHQIAVLQRSGTRRPYFRWQDRLFWTLGNQLQGVVLGPRAASADLASLIFIPPGQTKSVY